MAADPHDDAAATRPGPTDTLAILEALARGDFDVTEAERRLGGGAGGG
jgi:hypothetical protein